MTEQEILEYNKRCAEFLGKDKSGKDVTWTFPSYLNGDLWVDEHFFNNTEEYCGRRQTKVFELKFHSDWNWIMEVVEKIQTLDKRGAIVMIQQGRCKITSRMAGDNSVYAEVSHYFLHGMKKQKEAVVQAINQFLIWYFKLENTS